DPAMRLASRCGHLESHCNGKRQRQATSFLRDFFHAAGAMADASDETSPVQRTRERQQRAASNPKKRDRASARFKPYPGRPRTLADSPTGFCYDDELEVTA